MKCRATSVWQPPTPLITASSLSTRYRDPAAVRVARPRSGRRLKPSRWDPATGQPRALHRIGSPNRLDDPVPMGPMARAAVQQAAAERAGFHDTELAGHLHPPTPVPCPFRIRTAGSAGERGLGGRLLHPRPIWTLALGMAGGMEARLSRPNGRVVAFEIRRPLEDVLILVEEDQAVAISRELIGR